MPYINSYCWELSTFKDGNGKTVFSNQNKRTKLLAHMDWNYLTVTVIFEGTSTVQPGKRRRPRSTPNWFNQVLMTGGLFLVLLATINLDPKCAGDTLNGYFRVFLSLSSTISLVTLFNQLLMASALKYSVSLMAGCERPCHQQKLQFWCIYNISFLVYTCCVWVYCRKGPDIFEGLFKTNYKHCPRTVNLMKNWMFTRYVSTELS